MGLFFWGFFIMNKEESCSKLKGFLGLEQKIIERHIEKHKWFNGIDNRDEVVCDFIKKYAWIIREVYCSSVCENIDNCKLAEFFR
jgi:hypothetical protein